MNSGSGTDRTVIDFGSHLYPRSVFPAPMEGQELTELLGETLVDADAVLERYDAAGIDGAVLSQPFYMGHGDASATSAANDALLDLCRTHEQLFALASIPTGAGGDASATEFERCLDDGHHGGALETRSDGVELTDEELEPVLAVATDYGAPLFVHPKLNNSVAPGALSDTYRSNAIFGREIALADSICNVIHSGLLNRYPNLKLVYHHFGGNIASMLGRIELQLDDGRWPGQGEVSSFAEFERRLTGNIWIDTSGFFGDEAPLRAATDVFPASQLLFATDTPYEPRTESELRRMRRSVESVVSPDDVPAVLGGNALDLLVNTGE